MRDYAVRLGTRDEKRQGFPGGYRNVTPRPRPRSGRARHGRKTPRRGAGGPGRPAAPARGTAVATGAARGAWPPVAPGPTGAAGRPCRLAARLPVAPPVRALPRLAPLHGVRRPVAPVPVAPGRPHHGQPRAAGALPRGCPACRLRTCHALPPPGSGRPVCRRDPGSSGGDAPGKAYPHPAGALRSVRAVRPAPTPGRRPGVPEGERRGPRGRSEPGREDLTRRQRPDCRAVQVPVPTLPSTVSPRALW